VTYLLDSSIVSLLLRAARNPEVVARYARAESEGHAFVACPVVAYEVRRGLLHRAAGTQLRRLEALVGAWGWDDIRREDWEWAARTWAECAAQGRPINDADLLIAAHAARLGAVVVTHNVRDFAELGVDVEDWKHEGSGAGDVRS
jgi:predicted nucleic acid-binding protein